ncbi:hypothetical protein C0J52_10482 [Blattella germanica]|nr:hypothetical protein C0J52_10482 [Blattella germanica]
MYLNTGIILANMADPYELESARIVRFLEESDVDFSSGTESDVADKSSTSDDENQNDMDAAPILPSVHNNVPRGRNNLGLDLPNQQTEIDWKWELVNNVPSQANCMSEGEINPSTARRLGENPKEADVVGEFLTVQFWDSIVTQTNIYAAIKLQENISKDTYAWFPVTADELKAHFAINVAEQILECVNLPEYPSKGRPSDGISPMRLQGKYWGHFPSKIPPTQNKASPSRRCKVCYDLGNRNPKGKKRGESCYVCKKCNVALHVDDCFEIFHTQLNYF